MSLFLQLLLDLEKCTSWEKKVETFISHIPSDSVPLSVENQKTLCTTIYRHVVALKEYDLSSLSQLRTPITLLKPTVPSVHLAEEDYGLQKVREIFQLVVNLFFI